MPIRYQAMSALGPPCLTASRIWRAVVGAPTASIAQSTPPGLIAQIAFIASVFEALIPWVAPNSLANSSLRSTRSTAIIGLAPAIAAAEIADNPTPPAPNTATDWPSPTFAVCSTAPAPVSTAQPTRQVISVGSDCDIGTTFSANVTMCSLQVYTSPSAMRGRPWNVAPVGFETGNPLMGIRGTHVEMT